MNATTAPTTGTEFRTAYAAASKAHAEAHNAAKPLPDEIVAWAKANRPEMYAEYLVNLAAAVTALTAADAAFYALDAMACRRCYGTGEYQAPTGHLRNGRAECFDCRGDGRNAAARKAAAR